MSERLGGLPDDPDLAAAFGAGLNRQRNRGAKPTAEAVAPPAVPEPPQEVPEPAPVVPPVVPPQAPVEPPVTPVPVQPVSPEAVPENPVVVDVPNLGPTGKLTMQCAVNISLTVRERFTAYQAAKALETGQEPTNAIVMRRAVLAANKAAAFAAIRQTSATRWVQLDDAEDADPDDLFGEVEGRRATRGRIKETGQQPFRPSRQELAVIDAVWKAYGFPSRSDFLDSVLDWWLPEIPKKKR